VAQRGIVDLRAEGKNKSGYQLLQGYKQSLLPMSSYRSNCQAKQRQI
jgi:hypothetical protein